MDARHPSVIACLSTVRHPSLYRNFAVHAFVMFPAAMLMCAIAHGVDEALGISPDWSLTWRVLMGGALVGAGGLWVGYVYGFLYLVGHGSPGSHVDGGPTVLVDTGPYTMLRHPSVLGKLAGVIGLGIAWGSPTFLLGFVPVLVVYSLITNRYMQERYCDQRFGVAYERYRRVPMLLPRPSGIFRWLRREGALGAEGSTSVARKQPDGIRHELPLYLVGLVLLISLFLAAWGVVGWLGPGSGAG